MELQEFLKLITDVKIDNCSITGLIDTKLIRDPLDFVDWIENNSEIEVECDDIIKHIQQQETISFHLAPHLQDGMGYASYEQYFSKKRNWWQTFQLNTVFEHNWLQFKQSKNALDPLKLNPFTELLTLLADSGLFYKTGEKVTFFHNKYIILSLETKDTVEFVKKISNFSQKEMESILFLNKRLHILTNQEKSALRPLFHKDMVEIFAQSENITHIDLNMFLSKITLFLEGGSADLAHEVYKENSNIEKGNTAQPL